MAASDPAATLAARLRAGTARAHQQAEHSPLMQSLLGGHADRAGYARLLQQLLPLYEHLEDAVAARTDDPWLAQAWAPGLARQAALREDLAQLAPPAAELLPAMQAYLHRLDEAAGDPAHAGARLLAHVYVRHLGDLSGGQILRKALPGLRFHEFVDAAALRTRLRGALAALPAEGAAADAAVDEACWAFAQHLALFDALATADSGG